MANFRISVSVIDGEFLDCPEPMDFHCDKVFPQGIEVVRNPETRVFSQLSSANYKVYARRVFLFEYAGRLYGTTQFETVDEFRLYQYENCVGCVQPNECGLYLNGCLLVLNGCSLQLL